jgi:predicted dehydrogenase
MQAYCDQMSSFIDVIGGRPGLVGTGEDGRTAVAVCLAMLASSSARQWIQLGR